MLEFYQDNSTETDTDADINAQEIQDSPIDAISEQKMQESLETIAVPEISAQSTPVGAYIVGGVGCGIALIAGILCFLLLKKLSDANISLERQKNISDENVRKIQSLETQLNEIQAHQQSEKNAILSLQENHEKIISDIADIQIERTQSSYSSEELSALTQEIRKQQESLEYHDSTLRKLQAAQESFQQNTDMLQQQYASLADMLSTLQNNIQQQQQQKSVNASVPEFHAPVSPSAPSGEMPISFEEMLDILDQQYNQAIFLSVSSGIGIQPDFYEDTERKAHIILIQDRCYPNPYRFVNLEKQQETYSHLAVLAPVFDLRNIADGNGKYGLDSVLSAVVELQEDGSYTLRKKGVLSFC